MTTQKYIMNMETNKGAYLLKIIIISIIMIFWILTDTSLITSNIILADQVKSEIKDIEAHIDIELNKTNNHIDVGINKTNNHIDFRINNTNSILNNTQSEEKVFNLIFKKFYKVNNTIKAV